MMITIQNGTKITRFRDLWNILPQELKERIYGLRSVPQRADFHPEGNTLKHVITVVERAIRMGDPDIVCTALFHDIGKDVTFKVSPKGHPTAFDHEDESSKLVKEYRSLIKSLGGNPVIVYFLVKQHMRVKTLDQMRKRKQELLKSNPNFDKLQQFKSIDRGGLKIESLMREWSTLEDMIIPEEIKKLASAFKSAGHDLYVVGGAVRDYLLGKNPKDYDLATDAVPDESLKIIKSVGYRSLEVGKAFGVVIALPPSGEEYEIATFREDVGAGRRPDGVNFADIKTDVNRRDLTINALFYDIEANKVVDLVGGEKDLRSGTIRTVGDPEARFGEDPLRKLRALRFFAKLGKKIDNKTLHALRNNDLTGVSGERIRDEFVKSISGAQSPAKFLKLANTLGYMKYFLGNLSYNADFSNNNDPEVQLGILLASEDVQKVKSELLALKYSRDEIRNVATMLEILNAAKNEDFDRIYLLHRLYDIADKNKIKKFAKEMGISRFVHVLGKVDPKNVDMIGLTARFQKDALGNAIKAAVKDQFMQLYTN